MPTINLNKSIQELLLSGSFVIAIGKYAGPSMEIHLSLSSQISYPTGCDIGCIQFIGTRTRPRSSGGNRQRHSKT
jgi:hypothetical protein